MCTQTSFYKQLFPFVNFVLKKQNKCKKDATYCYVCTACGTTQIKLIEGRWHKLCMCHPPVNQPLYQIAFPSLTLNANPISSIQGVQKLTSGWPVTLPWQKTARHSFQKKLPLQTNRVYIRNWKQQLLTLKNHSLWDNLHSFLNQEVVLFSSFR